MTHFLLLLHINQYTCQFILGAGRWVFSLVGYYGPGTLTDIHNF